VHAHGELLRQASRNPELANHVVYLEDDPSFGPQERAIISFATKLTRKPWAMEERDLDALRETGLTEEQVLDVVLATCLSNFMTRLAPALGVDSDRGTLRMVREWLEVCEDPRWAFLREGLEEDAA
jgi:uncharacterized peroxidase-related enzyme